VASVYDQRVRKGRRIVMIESATKLVSPPASSAPRLPVTVKLRRISCDQAQAYPPGGANNEWWDRLKKALGTRSSAFVEASLVQLQRAARLPCGGISETAVNAALALIEAASPKDETEAALAVQMACTHTAAMTVLSLIAGGNATERRIAAFSAAAAKLLRTYAIQTEVLRRLHRGGEQYFRVEHVHVHEGAQAVIGPVSNSISEQRTSSQAQERET
jgi:hypothetical protein